MGEIISAALAAFATIVSAMLIHSKTVLTKRVSETEKQTEKRAAQRAEESRLSLELMHANCELTKGLAEAVKSGRPNGELEKGFKSVAEAQLRYAVFLETIALTKLSKD